MYAAGGPWCPRKISLTRPWTLSLPPTSAAAKYHSLRVYYQVQQWKGTDVSSCRRNGGGKRMMGVLYLSRQTYIQLHRNCYRSSDAAARQTAAAWGALAGGMALSALLHVQPAKKQGVQTHVWLRVKMTTRMITFRWRNTLNRILFSWIENSVTIILLRYNSVKCYKMQVSNTIQSKEDTHPWCFSMKEDDEI